MIFIASGFYYRDSYITEYVLKYHVELYILSALFQSVSANLLLFIWLSFFNLTYMKAIKHHHINYYDQCKYSTTLLLC
jgi:hypothetical protein